MDSPQSWNRYSYVQNNPIRFNDPTGHYCVGDDEDCVDGGGGTGPTPIIPPATSPGNACSGASPSMLCLPTPPQLPDIPILGSPILNQPSQPAGSIDASDLYDFQYGLAAGGYQYWLASQGKLAQGGKYTYVSGVKTSALGVNNTRYLTSNIPGYQAANLLKNASSSGSVLVSLAASVMSNGVEALFKPVSAQEFAVSVSIDTVLSVATGIAATTIALLLIGGSAPALAVAGVAIGIGFGISLAISASGAPDMIKNDINYLIDSP